MSGLGEDFASSNDACCDPEPIRDSLRDILRDAVQQYRGPIPRDEAELKRAVFNMLDHGFHQAREAGADLGAERLIASELMSEILFKLKDLLGTRLHIYALLICLGKIPDSEEQIARELRVTKAAVSKAKVVVGEYFNLPCRTGRTDSSRAKFSALALSRPRRQTQWAGQKYFAQL